ncbi:FHA domain-containing protein [uncultured Bifidobacterium sp.]|uniref:FHA domain-containing protein n=1 Tax=uncultured Bifidobacterium sp. TaxID=165187 RepID=UPI0026090371|nr:FHA domain-containing protein [uncultured Bifidobacterium sp.]
MTLKRITKQWVVTANGVECARVEQGQSVEIGRRPIRPIADSGMARVEISDATKSMSKRHATLSVDESGMATVRDLNSTNGSYVLRADGGLMRIQPGADFLLPTSSMRMQFGDVPIELTRIETESDEQDGDEVKDLFRYARTESEKPERDLTGLSVGDILDVRVGEPTIVFHAQPGDRQAPDQQTPDQQMRQQAQDEVSDASMPVTAPSTEKLVSPEDVAGDVVDDQALESGTVVGDDAVRAAGVDGSGQPDMDGSGKGDSDSPVSTAESSLLIPTARVARDKDHTVVPPSSDPLAKDTSTDDGANADDGAKAAAGTAGSSPLSTDSDGMDPDGSSGRRHTVDEETAMPVQNGATVFPAGSQSVRGSVFEPGSVFHRVSSGSFADRSPQVEVGGFTSEQARTSGDYTEQFAMARHTELLRFLAMNPGLYDDLYAWLAAQGDKDIDEALERNAGYREYRKTIGK